VVTAQKRTERLQDVPVPVTAINASALVEQNQLRLQDYFASVPGLSLQSGGRGDVVLSIRGLTTASPNSPPSNPTVGVTIDDVPFGSTTGLGSRTAVPDLDPSDLQRIEVLRGPQGTLYGAASIGGLLKYVTVEPSTNALSGRVEADVNGVYHGDGPGYGVRAAVNVPVNDTLAIRASGFARRDPGYIDNLPTGQPGILQKGVNQVDTTGAHVTALWRPSGNWSLKLSALLQDSSADGGPYVSPGFGALTQSQIDGTGTYTHDLQAYSATVSGSFAGITLTSLSGYSIDRYHGVNDLDPYFGGAGGLADLFFGVIGSTEAQNAETRKFTQEIRLSGSVWEHVDWLVGAFYTDENTPTHDYYYAVDPATPRILNLLYDDPYPTRYAEIAGFTDVTLRLSNHFDVQVGGRESENRQRYEEPNTGPIAGPVNPPEHTRENAFTYLVTPRYRVSGDLMVYARLASGFRPGGPNPGCIVFNGPCTYEPDKTTNYEVGIKGDALEHTLSFDASAYYINWRHVQLGVATTLGFDYYENAGGAASRGVEIAVQAKPRSDLTLSGWISLNDATITAGFPSNATAYGNDGDRLPGSSRISGSVAVQKDLVLTDRLTGFLGSSYTYVGNRAGGFGLTPTQPRLIMPGYGYLNLRTGVKLEAWTLNVFVNNVTDQRGELSNSSLAGLIYIQPLTAGVAVSRTF
jgi:iron complex outermembrane receptor protein